jgi:hypothetical protein
VGDPREPEKSLAERGLEALRRKEEAAQREADEKNKAAMEVFRRGASYRLAEATSARDQIPTSVWQSVHTVESAQEPQSRAVLTEYEGLTFLFHSSVGDPSVGAKLYLAYREDQQTLWKHSTQEITELADIGKAVLELRKRGVIPGGSP